MDKPVLIDANINLLSWNFFVSCSYVSSKKSMIGNIWLIVAIWLSQVFIASQNDWKKSQIWINSYYSIIDKATSCSLGSLMR